MGVGAGVAGCWDRPQMVIASSTIPALSARSIHRWNRFISLFLPEGLLLLLAQASGDDLRCAQLIKDFRRRIWLMRAITDDSKKARLAQEKSNHLYVASIKALT